MDDGVMTTGPDVPADDFLLTATGMKWPIRRIKPERLLEHQTVDDLVNKAIAMRDALAVFKEAAFSDVNAFMAILAEKYSLVRGGASGGVTLESFDLKKRIVVSSANFVTFGPEIQVAKGLIDECLTEWSASAGEEIRAIVTRAFEVGENGSLRVDEILRLRQHNFGHPKWNDAMAAINDAIKVAKSRRYIRFYRRDDADAAWEIVSLDASRL
jgi:hypothetical protein